MAFAVGLEEQEFTCDLFHCARPATNVEVGEAGDFWFCDFHALRKAYIHNHGAFSSECDELCGWYLVRRIEDAKE